jgi:hypothetical protein
MIYSELESFGTQLRTAWSQDDAHNDGSFRVSKSVAVLRFSKLRSRNKKNKNVLLWKPVGFDSAGCGQLSSMKIRWILSRSRMTFFMDFLEESSQCLQNIQSVLQLKEKRLVMRRERLAVNSEFTMLQLQSAFSEKISVSIAIWLEFETATTNQQ